jgi:hypothetical protein
MHIELYFESHKERDHQEDLDVGGRIILKCISACIAFAVQRSLDGRYIRPVSGQRGNRGVVCAAEKRWRCS